MNANNRISMRAALGGIICALSLVCMFLSGVFPVAEYTCPALAGIVLIVLVLEFGRKTAWIAYGAVALLSLFITPNKESAMLFLVFLGYYPIAKSCFEQLKSRTAEWVLKFLLFNVSCAAGYGVLIFLFGMQELLSEMSMGFAWGIAVFWIAANGVFLIYDFALSRLVFIYQTVIRPKIRL